MVYIGMLYFSEMFLCLRCHPGLMRMTLRILPVVGKTRPIHRLYRQRWPRLSLPWSMRPPTIPAFYAKWREINSSNKAEGLIHRDYVRLCIWTSLKPVPHYSSKPKIPSKLTTGFGSLSRSLDSSDVWRPRSHYLRLSS